MNYISTAMAFDSSAPGRAFRCNAKEATRGWKKFLNKGIEIWTFIFVMKSEKSM
jgi:hypothetical protein